MSRIVHKVESEIKQKLHLGHKEEDKKHHHEGEHKAEEYSGEHKAEHSGHREQVKDLMHKIKNKMGGGGHGKNGHMIKWHHHHNEEEECEEGEEGEEGENDFEFEVEEEEVELEFEEDGGGSKIELLCNLLASLGEL